jgi:hypothetical protein
MPAGWSRGETTTATGIPTASIDGLNRLLRNDGGGVFTRIAGLATRMALRCRGDSDNDGDLDLYVATTHAEQADPNDGAAFTQITSGPSGSRNSTGSRGL